MSKYLFNRLLIAIPTIFGVTVLIFLAMRVIPGDPLQLIVSESDGIYVLSEEELQALRASLGLDRPYHLQYLDWMAQVIKWRYGLVVLEQRADQRHDPAEGPDLGADCDNGRVAIVADRRADWDAQRDVAQHDDGPSLALLVSPSLSPCQVIGWGC